MSTREEKRQARISRYEALARKAECASQSAFEQSQNAVAGIPPGQPIPVGRHSEKQHRRAIERSWNLMDKSVEATHKAEYYRRKAEAAARNTAIYAEDEDAEERLETKIAELERLQEKMKAANKVIRNVKLLTEQKISALIELGFSESDAKKTLLPNCFGHIGFAEYTLKNNNARIRDAKARLERIKVLRNTAPKEYTIGEVRVIENTTENRLQLFFDGIPSEKVRTELKRHGFRWSRYNECWQAYLNRFQIDRAKTIIEGINE